MDYLEEITENLLSFLTMAAEWTKDETQALIKVCGDNNVQSKLDDVQRNRTINEWCLKCLARHFRVVARQINLLLHSISSNVYSPEHGESQ